MGKASAVTKRTRAGAAWLLSLLAAIGRRLYRWLKKYGFAFLVLIAIAGACYLAATVEVPKPVPSVALSGRGFAEVGTQGFKAEQVVVDQRQNTVFQGQRRVNRVMRDGLAELRAGMRAVDETLDEHKKQLQELKKTAQSE